MSFIYPQNYAIERIQQEYMPLAMEGRTGFDILPIKSQNVGELRWTQEDAAYGMQQFRGLNGEPAPVQRLGTNTFVFEPGVYGETSEVDEAELTKRAELSMMTNAPVDVGDLTNDIDRQLIGRDLDRKEYNVWTALQGTLTLSKPGPNGTVVQQTYTYPVQTYSATTPFATTATATPIAAFQSVQQMQVGRSVDFGAGATAYGNQYTLNNILNNQNSADFGGRRTSFGATINNLRDLASYWQAQNLPRLVSEDRGVYPTQAGAQTLTGFSKFIPNNTIIVVGRRPGNVPVGNYVLTRNLNNPGGAPGDYRKVVDSTMPNHPNPVPPKIVIHRGHNGGPKLVYSSAIVIMHV